jgi:hypothetical protein
VGTGNPISVSSAVDAPPPRAGGHRPSHNAADDLKMHLYGAVGKGMVWV